MCTFALGLLFWAQVLIGLKLAVDAQVAYIEVPKFPDNKVTVDLVWADCLHTFHGYSVCKVESTTKVMLQNMYVDRIHASQPQLYT